MGDSAISARKLACASPLTVLGVEVSLDQLGASFRPDEEKVAKWTSRIQHYLDARILQQGDASKLSGALQWAAQNTFKRVGRAMLRPLFRHACHRCCYSSGMGVCAPAPQAEPCKIPRSWGRA